MIYITKIQSAKRYMDKNYASIVSIKEISKNIGCCYNSLRAEFVKHEGITLGNYLNLCRCEKAKKLLKKTDWKLYKIALEVGFNDDKYFIKVFEKYFDIPPCEYRKCRKISI